MNTSHVKFVKIAFLIALGLVILGTVLYDSGRIRNASADVYVSGTSLVESGNTGPSGKQSCTTVGPPPGMATVTTSATIYKAPLFQFQYDDWTTYSLVVSIENKTVRKKTITVYHAVEETASVGSLVEVGGLKPGDSVSLNVYIKNDGNTVDSVARTVTAEKREYRCTDMAD